MGKNFQKPIDWYNTNAKKYALQSSKYASHAQINDFVRLLSDKARVLDAGCGSGRDTNLLAQKGLDVVGIDLSSGLINIAKTAYPGLKFIEGNFLKLPFEDNFFDGVWAHASLVHLESINEVEKALREFDRILKKGGAIHIAVRTNTEGNKFEIIKDEDGNVDKFFQYFTKEELESLVKKTGFIIVKQYQFKDPNSNKKYRKIMEWIICLAKK